MATTVKAMDAGNYLPSYYECVKVSYFSVSSYVLKSSFRKTYVELQDSTEHSLGITVLRECFYIVNSNSQMYQWHD